VSSGGFDATNASASSRISRIVRVVCVKLSFEIEEIGLSWTESESPKTKARRREYVDEERKMSWSFLERILRVGTWKWTSSSDGGGGRDGVAGAGSDDGADSLRRRGRSRGIFSDRSSGFVEGFELGTAMAMFRMLFVRVN